MCGYLTRWLLASEREHLAEAAKKGIGVLVKHPTHFTRVFNTQYMADILTNSEYRNRMNQVGGLRTSGSTAAYSLLCLTVGAAG